MPSEYREVKTTLSESQDVPEVQPADQERGVRDLSPEELALQEGEVPARKTTPPNNAPQAATKSARPEQ